MEQISETNLPDHHDLVREAIDYHASDPDPANAYEISQLDYERFLLGSKRDPAQAYETALLNYGTLLREAATHRSIILAGTIDLSFIGSDDVFLTTP